jgi:hypothetical protein
VAESELPLAALPAARHRDWSQRPFDAAGVPPAAVGAAFALLVLAISQLARWALGEPFGGVPWGNRFLGLDVLNAALLGYVPTASAMLRRARLADLHALRPALDCDAAAFEEHACRAFDVPPRRLALAGLAGALTLGSMPLYDPSFWLEEPPSPLSATFLFFTGRMALMGWLAGHALAAEVRFTSTLAQLGARHARVDLLDLEPLAPFARAGQRGALAWVLVSSLISLFWLGPIQSSANRVILVVILALVVLEFGVSIYGVHRRIAAAKRDALRALDARIRPHSQELLAGTGAAAGEAPRLADLLALRRHVESAREWPLGRPTWLRWGLIALLAAGSWLGGALAERVLESAFR